MSTIPAALASIGTLLQYGSGASPESWTTIANVNDFGGPSFTSVKVDVTSHSTGLPWVQRIITLLDAGSIPFKLFFIPASTAMQAFLSLYFQRGRGGQGVPIDFRIVFPDTAATKWYLYGYIGDFKMNNPVAGVTEASCTIELTSEPIIPGVNA